MQANAQLILFNAYVNYVIPIVIDSVGSLIEDYVKSFQFYLIEDGDCVLHRFEALEDGEEVKVPHYCVFLDKGDDSTNIDFHLAQDVDWINEDRFDLILKDLVGFDVSKGIKSVALIIRY